MAWYQRLVKPKREEVQGSDLGLVSVGPAASWGEQQQQMRKQGKESSSQNWGHDKCTERAPGRLAERLARRFSTCVRLTIPQSVGRLKDTSSQKAVRNTEGILCVFKVKQQLNLAVP
ncbi:hypothetical protein EYF80_031042 [Liparis tanakae]|uniref:Uncharacterized protein n=1 Tax=Liparis tanakae TaxID=230148 RepID=A0A4Z2GYJ4_9TELE|nr:hypothetical protein EYF80_031042 [Liparis tanakae]